MPARTAARTSFSVPTTCSARASTSSRTAAGDDDDAVRVADDPVARRDPHLADLHLVAPVDDLPAGHRVLRRDEAGEDREPGADDDLDIAAPAVENDAGDAAGLERRGRQLAELGAAAVAGRVHRDVAGRDRSEQLEDAADRRLVLVVRMSLPLDREGRAGYGHAAFERPDLRRECLPSVPEAVEDVGHGRRVDVHTPATRKCAIVSRTPTSSGVGSSTLDSNRSGIGSRVSS